MSDVQELQERLAQQSRSIQNQLARPTESAMPDKPVEKQDILEHIQWEVLPNGAFGAAGSTTPHLTPGAYLIGMTDRGPIFVSKKILTDDLVFI